MTEDISQNGHLEKEKKKEDVDLVYDRGWGWCVVVACFLCNVVNDGIAYSFGVIMEPMRTELGVGVGSISMVGGVLAGATMLIGPAAAAFVNRFGSRITCIAGSLIAASAIFISSFASSISVLLLSYGLLAGCGLGFIYIPAVVAVGDYFRARLSLATGICVCGSGFGTFLVAPLTSYLLEKFGWRGCNRFTALLCLACSFFGLVMVPNKKRNIDNTEEVDSNEERTGPQQESIRGRSILFDIPFLLMTLGNIPFAMAIYTSYTYLPSMGVQAGLSSSDASFLISVIGISNTVGRLVSGWLAGLQWTTPLWITIITTFLASICAALLPFAQHYLSLLLLAAVYGFIISSGPTVSTPLLVDLLGINQLNTAFGMLTFARGFAALIGPSAAGFLLDTFSSTFSLPFYLSSALFGVSGVLHIGIYLKHNSGFPSRSGYTTL